MPINLQALIFQTLDGVIHRMNHYPVDKYWWNQLAYLLNSGSYSE